MSTANTNAEPASPGCLTPSSCAISFREIHAGFERIPAGKHRPRHAHFAPYATILLEGQLDQASYVGRMRLEAGDVLIQPNLDRHDSRIRANRSLYLLRLSWPFDRSFGGLHRELDVSPVIRAARKDPREAGELLHSLVSARTPPAAHVYDWPDLLAADLRVGSIKLGQWAEKHGLSRETLSRGFGKAFAVTPKAFAAEVKAREAWMRVVSQPDALASVAADLGYADQPHMTRAIRAFTGIPPLAWRRHLARNGKTIRHAS